MPPRIQGQKSAWVVEAQSGSNHGVMPISPIAEARWCLSIGTRERLAQVAVCLVSPLRAHEGLQVFDVGKRIERSERLLPVANVMSVSPSHTTGWWRGGTNAVLLPYLAILFVWWLWSLEPFHHVGMAAGDQLMYSQQGLTGIWANAVKTAQAQGRVTFLFTKPIDYWLAARPEHWLRNTINIVVFALSSCCFAGAVFREPGQRLLYVWLFASVAWAGFQHLPPAAYPTVNHVPFLLWPIAAWVVRSFAASGGARRWSAWSIFGAVAFVALYQYEPSAIMSLVVLSWIVYREPSSPFKKGLWYVLGAAVGLNFAAYVSWRLAYPPHYSGVSFASPSVWDVFRVTVALTVGALPFCDAYRGQTALRWGDETIGYKLLRGPKGEPDSFDALGILLGVCALASLLAVYLRVGRKSAPAARRNSYALWAMVALLLVGINGPLGLSRKYTKWVTDFDSTYLTSQLALYPIVMAGVLGLDWAYRRLRVRKLPVVFVALVVALTVIGLKVHSHNERVTARQRGMLARWEGAAALAAFASRIEQKDLVAPDLFYSMYAHERDWGKWWSRYLERRYGRKFKIHAELPRGLKDAALMRMHLFDDGRLRAITIQTPKYVAVVAKPGNGPAYLTSDRGAGESLKWAEAESLDDSGYFSLRQKKPKEFVGLERAVEPVWLFPNRGLALPR